MNNTAPEHCNSTKNEQPTQPQTTNKNQHQDHQQGGMTTSTTTTAAFAQVPVPVPARASDDGKETTTTKKNIRYAERRRTSTCIFADRVAQLSVDTYKSLIPESERPPQTCIATIVAHYRGRTTDDDDDVRGTSDDCDCDGDGDGDNDDPTGDESSTTIRRNRKGVLRVISLGVGTKFLPESILNTEIMNSNHNTNNKDHNERNNRERKPASPASTKSASSTKNEYQERNHNQWQGQDEKDLPYGCRVRDLHAEILARRAFRRYLTSEIHHDMTNNNSIGSKDHDKKNQNWFSILVRSKSISTDGGNDGCDECKHSNSADGGCDDGNSSSSSSSNTNNSKIKMRHKYKLRPGVTLHLYTSSAPCGNATLKRFCKMSKEKFRDDLGEDEWPDQKLQSSSVNISLSSSHEPFFGHSKKLGEFSLLIKKDNSTVSRSGSDATLDKNLTNARRSYDNGGNNGLKNLNDGNCDKIESGDNISSDELVSNGKKRSRSAAAAATNDENDNVEEPPSSSSNGHPSIPNYNEDEQNNNGKSNNNNTDKNSRRKPKLWPADQSDDWTPPGTTIVGFRDKGSIHTCSDKILRWNVLGLQGSLLSSLLDEPLYLSTLTVGRKLSGAICRRAVCCRLGHGPFVCMPVATSVSTASKNSSDGLNTSDLCRQEEQRRRTYGNMYRLNHPSIMGTSVYLDETGVVETNPESHGQDVRFHSSSCWAWWNDVEKPFPSTGGSLECIDGATGFMLKGDDDDDNLDPKKASLVSTQELTMHFSEVYRRMLTVVYEDKELAGPENSKTDRESTTKRYDFSTLSELHFLKKQVSPIHENVKDYVLQNDRVLYQWRRR